MQPIAAMDDTDDFDEDLLERPVIDVPAPEEEEEPFDDEEDTNELLVLDLMRLDVADLDI